MKAYHGTNQAFERFEKPAINKMADRAAIGFWFSASKEEARTYGDRVIGVYIFNKPLKNITLRELDFLAVSKPAKQIVEEFKRQGFHGFAVAEEKPDPIMETQGNHRQYVLFDADDFEIVEEYWQGKNLHATPSGVDADESTNTPTKPRGLGF